MFHPNACRGERCGVAPNQPVKNPTEIPEGPVTKHESEKVWRMAHYIDPKQVLTTNRRVVDARTSGDAERLASSLLASKSYP